MSNINMEVKITLTPLGKDEKQNHRTISITPDNLSVSVGRASKNPSKGLLAAPDNAWFDYPILSRTHAKFTASRNQQEIFLQDCGSTHGTYIDKQRLKAGVEFAVADGEVITFGQKVTSGAVTYPAKDFRVHSKWQSRSEVQDSSSTTTTRTQRLVYTASISRPAFTNDFDHSSEPSREGSVQIVESHRHTFSVPSSDDEIESEDEEEEVHIASSVQGDDEEVSAATTPDRQAAGKPYTNTEDEAEGSKNGPPSGETRGLNLKGPSLHDLLTNNAKDGTSQENPINLEGVCTNIIDVDTESEDDGPDVLPFYESSKAGQPNRSRVWDESQVAHQTSAVTMPTTMTVGENQSDRDSEIRIVPETQAKVAGEDEARGNEPMNVLAESTAGATDGFGSEDDDGFDYDPEFFPDEDLEPFPDPAVLNVGVPNSSKPKVTFQVGSKKPYYTTLTPPFDELRPARLDHILVSDAIDVSEPAEPSSAWAQRAPSPSDAALARKASDPKTSLGRDIFDNFPEPQWPAAATTTYSHYTEHAPKNAASREENNGAFSWPELQSPEPRSYDQGPFSSQPKVVIPAPRSPKPGNVKNQSKKATVTWADPYDENDDMMMNADRFTRTGKQTSKITIPSLVENYLAENPRSFKRKYGGLNKCNDVEATPNAPKSSSPVPRTSGYKRTFAEANPDTPSCSFEEELLGTKVRSHVDLNDFMWQSGEDHTMQRPLEPVDGDTPLPDAQPRENIVQTPAASMSQDSIAEPAVSSVPTTTTAQGEDAEGPARKKVRTSSSSSGGIGKFVMGVGFGLLGAAAAFVATIPASVYEEALRELGNAT